MVVGFNHNFRYKGEVFHVQTEDGGVKNPQIVTLLYRAGSILSSQKTSYAELLAKDDLVPRVEGLMKEQHRDMLRRLKDGEFDVIIEKRGGPSEAPVPPARAPSTATQAAPKPQPSPPPPPTPAGPAISVAAAIETNLDDILLSYLLGDDY